MPLCTAVAGGAFSLAYAGSALNTIGKIKSQIMLNGGVITLIAMSQAVFDHFKAYSNTAAVFDTTEDLSPSRSTGALDVAAYMHALFCYGWRDTANGNGHWLCKDRCAGPELSPSRNTSSNMVLHCVLLLGSSSSSSTECFFSVRCTT
jgi:hypothetical protein